MNAHQELVEVNLDAARQEIIAATAVDEILSIRKKLTGMISYYKAERDPEKVRRAAELKLLAEVRIGQMSKALEKASGGDRKSEDRNQTPATPEFDSKLATLKAAGISSQEASQFERLASLPKAEITAAAQAGKSARSILRAHPEDNEERNHVMEHLHYNENLSWEEISTRYKLTPKACKDAVSRQRKKDNDARRAGMADHLIKFQERADAIKPEKVIDGPGQAIPKLIKYFMEVPTPKAIEKVEFVISVKEFCHPKDIRTLAGALHGVAERAIKLAQQLEQMKVVTVMEEQS